MDGKWGSLDRYYAAVNPIQRPLTHRERLIAEKLERRFPNLAERVERSFRDSNLLIREHLRSETRLRLSNLERSQSVPVKIVAGIPDVLLDVLDVDPDIMDLYLDLSLLKKSSRGIARVVEKHSFLQQWTPMKGQLPSVLEFNSTGESIMHLCAELEKLKFFDEVWGIQEDILGAYFFQQCKIELYWMPIGLFAAKLQCSPESLTQVVAIHELAHAYTHIGFDIDDRAWATEDFARSSTHVVEGLAQFFTEAVCQRLAGRYPETLKTYGALLERQSGPYRTQLEWLTDDEAGGEVVRSAMILFRSHSEVTRDVFREMLEDSKNRLGRRSKTKPKTGTLTDIPG